MVVQRVAGHSMEYLMNFLALFTFDTTFPCNYHDQSSTGMCLSPYLLTKLSLCHLRLPTVVHQPRSFCFLRSLRVATIKTCFGACGSEL